MKNHFKKYFLNTFLVLFLSNTFLGLAYAQKEDKKKEQYQITCISFYNVENLYDTISDPKKDDKEFIPNGNKRWNSEKYNYKLGQLAQVINDMGKPYGVDAPLVMGLCEVENRKVLEDLVKHKDLKNKNYGIAHQDSPDHRGVDVALIYRKEYFKFIAQNSHVLNYPETNFATRSQLVVTGLFEKDTLSFIVNHWPSRRGGERKSDPKRIAAAKLTRSIVDSLLARNPKAKVMVMGDLNDSPVDNSVYDYLLAREDINEKNKSDKTLLFNPMYHMHKQGMGTLAHADKWQIFDQIILTPALVENPEKGHYHYVPKSAKVFMAKYLMQDSGKFKGYPFRTYVGDNFMGGYSDHFPVFIFLGKKI